MSLEGLMVAALALAVLLAIVAGAGYFLSRRAGEQAARPTITATPAPVEALLASPSSTALISPVGTPALSANPQGGVTLTLEATEHVWARVTADGQTMFTGMLATGQIEAWSAQEVIAVDTGNGAGLLVTINGQSQDTMCGRAQACTRRWGPSGEITAP